MADQPVARAVQGKSDRRFQGMQQPLRSDSEGDPGPANSVPK
jgi:hypothetical protein